MSLFSELSEFMVSYRFRPEKRLSQHFLVDEKTIQRLIRQAGLSKTDVVLEIGCGTGFLTRELLKHCRKVIGIEKDLVLANLLRSEIKEKNFELLEGDALEEKWPRFTRMVSLPPYDISSPLVLKLVHSDFKNAVLVFQREFVERLIAQAGFLDYNALSVLVQYYCEPKLAFLVSNNSFFPRPPGFSAVLELAKKKRFGTTKNDAAFDAFVKQLFRHKNKSVSNALQLALPFLKNELVLSFAECKQFKWKHWNEKVYTLHAKQFVELFNQIYK